MQCGRVIGTSNATLLNWLRKLRDQAMNLKIAWDFTFRFNFIEPADLKRFYFVRKIFDNGETRLVGFTAAKRQTDKSMQFRAFFLREKWIFSNGDLDGQLIFSGRLSDDCGVQYANPASRHTLSTFALRSGEDHTSTHPPAPSSTYLTASAPASKRSLQGDESQDSKNPQKVHAGLIFLAKELASWWKSAAWHTP